MNKKILIILMLIVVIASFLRIWQIDKVPISPDWDEVALGYNAYSILHTGRDEYGKFLPIVLRSFDDYKPALYAYFVISSVAIFGLNVFAVRLPSAVFGILTVFATYFLVKELFKLRSKSEILNSKQIQNTPASSSEAGRAEYKILNTELIALLSAFLLAISPWHIQFSRIAFESNVGLSFNIFALLFFIKGLKKPIFLILSAIFMSVNIYIYQSEKVFVPLLLLILVIIFRKQLFSIPKKFLVLSILTGLIIALPMISYMITDKNVLGRAKGVSVFSESTQLLQENAIKLIDDKKNNDVLGLMLDNRRLVFAKSVVSGYLSHFDFNWLFISGDISRHHAPNMGLLYIVELPFLFIGIYSLFFGKFDKKTKFLIFSWFLIAPIPASITSGVPHAVRTLNFLPTFQIFTAIGLISVFQFISSIKYKVLSIRVKYLILLLYLSFFIFNFFYYLNQYFVQQNYFNAADWQYGYAKIIPEMQKIEANYKKIIISNEPPMDQSYMFFLFYLKYPPSLYQTEGRNVSGGFKENHFFGKYEFRPINWNNEEKNKDILFIGRPVDFSKNTIPLYTIFYPDGKPAIQIVN